MGDRVDGTVLFSRLLAEHGGPGDLPGGAAVESVTDRPLRRTVERTVSESVTRESAVERRQTFHDREFDPQSAVTPPTDGSSATFVVAENEERRPCTDCGGDGTRDCRRCDGDERRRCPDCDGDGTRPTSRTCPDCQGGTITSTVDCGSCSGAGVVPDGDGGESTCPSCDGDGSVESTAQCGSCGGSGSLTRAVDCERCGTTGSLPCDCGDGTERCGTCGGKGERVHYDRVTYRYRPSESATYDAPSWVDTDRLGDDALAWSTVESEQDGGGAETAYEATLVQEAPGKTVSYRYGGETYRCYAVGEQVFPDGLPAGDTGATGGGTGSNGGFGPLDASQVEGLKSLVVLVALLLVAWLVVARM